MGAPRACGLGNGTCESRVVPVWRSMLEDQGQALLGGLLWPLNFKSWELFEAETGAKKIGHDILLFMLPSSIMFFMQNWAT